LPLAWGPLGAVEGFAELYDPRLGVVIRTREGCFLDGERIPCLAVDPGARVVLDTTALVELGRLAESWGAEAYVMPIRGASLVLRIHGRTYVVTPLNNGYLHVWRGSSRNPVSSALVKRLAPGVFEEVAWGLSVLVERGDLIIYADHDRYVAVSRTRGYRLAGDLYDNKVEEIINDLALYEVTRR